VLPVGVGDDVLADGGGVEARVGLTGTIGVIASAILSLGVLELALVGEALGSSREIEIPLEKGKAEDSTSLVVVTDDLDSVPEVHHRARALELILEIGAMISAGELAARRAEVLVVEVGASKNTRRLLADLGKGALRGSEANAAVKTGVELAVLRESAELAFVGIGATEHARGALALLEIGATDRVAGIGADLVARVLLAVDAHGSVALVRTASKARIHLARGAQVLVT